MAFIVFGRERQTCNLFGPGMENIITYMKGNANHSSLREIEWQSCLFKLEGKNITYLRVKKQSNLSKKKKAYKQLIYLQK